MFWLTHRNGQSCLLGFFLLLCNSSGSSAADVLFYGLGKGHNFQQTGATTTVGDPVDPWEATAFVFVNPAGAVTAAYVGPTTNPTLYPMQNDGDSLLFSASGASQSVVDGYLPNGTPFRVTMQTVHDGTKAVDFTLSGNTYPNTPLATNYAAMQAVGPNTNFTISWNGFTGGTTNDVIIASLVANQYAPYGSITNSQLPGTPGALNGTSRFWTIPANYLQPNSHYWVRIVYYKVVMTNKTAYTGVTGYGVYGTGTTIPLVTSSTGPAAPVVTASPTNQTVYVGSNVLMSVTATGSGLSYQWRRSNTNLPAATASVYSIANAQLGSSGNYKAVVSNAGGSVTSAVAILTVILPPAPSITASPTNQTVYVGSNVLMTVAATGSGLSYQWRRSNTNLPAATASVYSIPNAQVGSSGNYKAVVSNTGGSVTSAVATLTVILPPAPTITASPTNQTVYVGSNVLVSVTATGSGLNYQWRRSNTNLAAATSSFYYIPNAQLSNSGDYRAVVSNVGGSVTSAVATLTVILPPAPTISQQPTNVAVTAGATANFYVVANGFNVTYQWRGSGTNIAGSTTSNYSVVNAQLADALSYAVVVANAGGSVTSSPAILTIQTATLSDGALDPTFNPGTGANSWVNIVTEQIDGKLLIGGLFTTFNGSSRPYVARLNWDGSLDSAFNPGTGPNNALVGLAVQGDGKPVIAGFFTTVAGQNFRYVARLQANGVLDPTFASGTNVNNTVKAVAIQPDGKVLIGGDFTAYNTTNRNRIARLNADGSLDASFNPGTGVDSTVNAIIVQPDGKILIGGNFGTVNSVSRTSIARLNTDGSLDPSFTPGTGAQFWVNGMALQSDGKIMIGGPFTTYNGTSRKGVARLLPSGTLDTAFDPLAGADNWVNSVALDPDGKIAVGGIFTNINNVVVNHIARLGATGVRDAVFSSGSGFNDAIQSIIRCANGTYVIGGLFTSYNGTPANRIARLIAAPGAPYPLLQFGVSGASLNFHWPATLGSYQLQASPVVSAAFTNVNAVLTTNGSDVSASVPIGPGASFFRLRK